MGKHEQGPADGSPEMKDAVQVGLLLKNVQITILVVDDTDMPLSDVDVKADTVPKGQTKEGKLVIFGDFLQGEIIEVQASKDGFLVMDPVEYVIKPMDKGIS